MRRKFGEGVTAYLCSVGVPAIRLRWAIAVMLVVVMMVVEWWQS
jgi:hypothetical protein